MLDESLFIIIVCFILVNLGISEYFFITFALIRFNNANTKMMDEQIKQKINYMELNKIYI